MADEDEGGGQELEEEIVCPEGAPEWVVTFGDMMSLLLTFFILLLSFSTMDVLKFKDMAGSIKQGFGLAAPENPVITKGGEDVVPLSLKVEHNAQRIAQELKRRLDPRSRVRRQDNVDIEVFQSYRGLSVLLKTDQLFERSTDRLTAAGRALLDYVGGHTASVWGARADELGRVPMELAVEVHGAEAEGKRSAFEDAWGLSTAQAVSASRYLRGQGLSPGRVRPVGRGPRAESRVELIFLSAAMRAR